jgi:hypothetical protein
MDGALSACFKQASRPDPVLHDFHWQRKPSLPWPPDIGRVTRPGDTRRLRAINVDVMRQGGFQSGRGPHYTPRLTCLALEVSRTMKALLSRIQERTARVGIIGQGYVGLPLGLVFSEAGFPVTGFDVDPAKVEALRRGESYIKHIGPERVAAAVASGAYEATTDFDRLSACDAIFICVPTPLGSHREPDNSYIHRTSEQIAKRLRPGQIVVLESTTYPGTTDGEVQGILSKSGLKTPEDYFLAFSPERQDQGNEKFSTKSIPKVVGGVNPAPHAASWRRACAMGTPSARIGTRIATVVADFWFVWIAVVARTNPRNMEPVSPMKMEAGLKL